MKEELKELLTIVMVVYNEEKLLPRALESIARLNVNVIVFDSYSSDKTVEIAKSFGCVVVQDEWDTWTVKVDSAINSDQVTTPWVMRIDADEFLTDELVSELKRGRLSELSKNVVGLWVARRFYFLDKWIKHGDMYPQHVLRISRHKSMHYEDRIMDEHLVVSGETDYIAGDIVDSPDRGLSSWIEKHLRYAKTECIVAHYSMNKTNSWRDHIGKVKIRRFLKERVYSRLPLLVRPFIYWFYRYFLRLGFLDGRQGAIFHFLHAFWYRFMIDALLFESKATKECVQTYDKLWKENCGSPNQIKNE